MPKLTLYWIFYVISWFLGFPLGPRIMNALYGGELFGGNPVHVFSEFNVGECYFGSLISTIWIFFLIRRIKNWKLYAGLPLVCFIGFFSYFPGIWILG